MMQFGRGALVAGALVLLAGCSGWVGSVPGSPADAGVAGTSASRLPDISRDLLYVAHSKTIYSQNTVVSIVSLPKGTPVAQISLGYLAGMCSDTGGNVWLIAYRSSVKAYYAEKYAHGGTKPIARIRISKYGAYGCAVDPTSGDLAVMNPSGGREEGWGSIDIWAGARPGKPAVYNVPFTPKNGAYDNAGNLFIDGCDCADSDPGMIFSELAKGSGAVASVKIDKNTAFPGGVQWDGQDIAVQTGGYQHYMRGRPRIYRIQASGGSGHVVGTVIPKDPALSGVAWFAVYGNSVVSTQDIHHGQVDIWPYPTGGANTGIVGSFGYIRGLTISVGPHS